MSAPTAQDLDQAFALPPEQQAVALTEIGRRYIGGGDAPPRLIEALAALVEQGTGAGRERLALGEVLGWLGDPRLRRPADEGYWVALEGEEAPFRIGRFPVTNLEFQAFVNDGGYEDPALWGDDGAAWLASADSRWIDRASQSDSGPYIVPNQPVVGVTWFEARAFARAHGARLPRFDERKQATRGTQKRPYPWGSPFGEGNANTQEEVLGRPCAVGLFVRDRTPEGVRDLAGNVAEWNEDGVGAQRWIHPGAWDQPSMASWAKARFLEPPDSHWAGLGFRLAQDG